MESIDLTQDDITSSPPEYSVYSRAPSETNVELDLNSCATALSESAFNLSGLEEALQTAIHGSDEELDVTTAASYSHDLNFLDGMESGVEYSFYSPTPSEVDVEFESGFTDFPEAETESVATAIWADGSEVEMNVLTANSMDSISTSKSFMDQASVYVPKPSTTLVEFDDNLTCQTSSPLTASTARSYSCYSGLPSETECEIPFTFNVGGARVVDSNELIFLQNAELKPAKFYGVDKYLDGVEKQSDVNTEANFILAHNDTSGINLNESDEIETTAKDDAAPTSLPQ